MPITLETLSANPAAMEWLAWHADFQLPDQPGQPAWFSFDGIPSFERLGKDSSGSAFVQLPGSPRIFYVTSEGQAGAVAADFEVFIGLIVSRPYWRDILKYSGNGNLEQMQRASPVLEEMWLEEQEEEEQDAGDSRLEVKSELGLAVPSDAVAALHRAASATDIVIRAPDGHPCASLFNRFTIDVIAAMS